jgi:uncharacterized protein YbjQ (UPF0145 family)
MKRFQPLLLILCLLFFNCPTADKHVKTIGSDDQANIQTVELRLLEYQANHNIGLLKEAENDLKQMEKRGEYNKKYRAKVWGLYGLIYFYKKDNAQVKKCLTEIEYANRGEEYYFILQSRLEKSPEAGILALNQGLKEADETSHIKLELAEIYLSLNDYRNAAAFYDAALPGLSQAYKDYYKKNRDLAYNSMGKQQGDLNAKGIIGIEVLTTEQIIKYILSESNFFDNITVKKDIFAADLLNKLKDQGYVVNKDLSIKDSCLRKDLAYLLLRILVRQKNDPSLLDKYSKKYLATGRKSPLPDVVTNDYFFDAALVLVEQEIMELPDGKNFFPDKTVSGFELTNMLKKLKTQ